MIKFNQKGFATVEAILLVVILAMLAGTGYYVWHSNQQANKTFSDASKSANSSPSKVQKSSSNNSEVQTASYLVIKEWGVRIKLSDKTRGAYYSVNEGQQPGSIKYLSVFAPQADAIVGPAGVSCKGEYIVYLERLAQDDPDFSDPSQSLFTTKIIGNYTFGMSTKKQYGPECYETSKEPGNYAPDNATADKFAEVVNSFVSDFKTLETSQ